MLPRLWQVLWQPHGFPFLFSMTDRRPQRVFFGKNVSADGLSEVLFCISDDNFLGECVCHVDFEHVTGGVGVLAFAFAKGLGDEVESSDSNSVL